MHNTTNFYKNESYDQRTTKTSNEYIYGVEGRFEKIAQNLAEEYDYIPDVFDCTEFSEELNKRYKMKGWKSKKISVKVDCNSELFNSTICRKYNGRHDIVYVKDVYVEATTGEIIDPSNYKVYGI